MAASGGRSTSDSRLSKLPDGYTSTILGLLGNRGWPTAPLRRERRETITLAAEFRRGDERLASAQGEVHRLAEQGPMVNKGVKFTVLPAGIHTRRQVGDEGCVVS